MENKWRRRPNNLGASNENIANRHFRNIGRGQQRGRNNRIRSLSRPRHNNPDNNRQDNRNDRRYNDNKNRSMSFRYVESLLEQSPEDISTQLTKNSNGLEQLTQSQISNDFLILLIKMLKKCCESPYNQTKYSILQIAFNDTFLSTLKTFIATLPAQDEFQKKRNSYFWRDTDEFWDNLLYICDDLLKTIPTVGCKIASQILKQLQLYLPLFEQQSKVHIADAIHDRVEFLLKSIEIINKMNAEKAVANNQNNNAEIDEEPPNDFRSISIYPSADELKGECEFLRRNIIKGAYKDIEQYLDIQFRLLREDFVTPLRKGIRNYLFNQTTNEKRRLENIRIYRPIRFLHHETVRQNYALRIRFNFTKRKTNVRFENSKRFMFGSLLCFTNDNFQTILFGRVEDRKLEDLKKGELIVGFDQPTDVLFNVDYLMVESNVYFEPYYHVLSVLQQLSTEHFPMDKYLIYCQSDITPPQYLTPQVVEVLKNRPNLKRQFNESQFNAFTAALTQEFILIQGPPGTGKTYVGLAIARFLLASELKQYWYKRSPMLVICFTNHALDQFLEGLLETTKDIIRVGGQSKNEKLNKYNLRERKKNRKRPNSAIIDKRIEIRSKLAEIKSWTTHLNSLNSYQSIIKFEVFKNVIEDFNNTWFARANNEEILNWLLGGRNNQQMEEEEEPDIAHGMAALNIGNTARSTRTESNDDDDDDDEDDDDDDDEENPAALVDDEIFINLDIDELVIARDLISLPSINTEIKSLENRFRDLEQEEESLEKLVGLDRIERQLRHLYDTYNHLQKRLEQGRLQEFHRPLGINLNNPQNLRPYMRWALYFNWLEQYKRAINQKLSIMDRKFRQIYQVYEELRDMEDVAFMRQADVIGMTTTCAARLRSSLQALKCPIVIVEEAAEVLEAHIVSALNTNCQHLILIGDHQQLKPSAADYRIETDYKLGISLFERMILNNIHCYTLNIQHRMRPEISTLVSSTIYHPILKDHESVHQRPKIRGTDHVLYFIDHQNDEEECDDTSKKNIYEAEFLLAYANHLILNGYKTENITIIAAYLGQMFEMQRIRKQNHLLKDLRIAVLDNYQGEESDIILLSLVRSNKENKIGFLKIENRVCVALSRARNGMFIMGNMTQLFGQSDLWGKINEILKTQNAIGPTLPLRCEVHPDVVTHIKTAKDFKKIPEGGCSRKCNFQLACQHFCTKLCHVTDRNHVNYQCLQICGKQLCDKDETHKCEDRCFEECRPCYYRVLKHLPCGHDVHLQCSQDIETYKCIVPVPTVLLCGHKVDKPCHRDTETFPCTHPCETKVEPCGHSCLLKCHINNDPDHFKYRCLKPCARFMKDCTLKLETHVCNKRCYEECDKCHIIVQKKRTKCPHLYRIPCSDDVDEIVCEKPCTQKLPCGHKCKNKCNEPCGACKVIVDKSLPLCGHIVKAECSQEPDRKNCRKQCPLKLPCGHPCTKKCNQPCTEKCEFLVNHKVTGKCGHVIQQVYCYMKTTQDYNEKLLKLCTEPCTVELKCGHKCTGNCGECLQNRFHKRCQEKCGEILICNHECQLPCRAACRPCRLPCSFKCVHSKCGKLCGELCTPCKEKCIRSCEHQKCSNKCGYLCDVPPCNEPCNLKLECGHNCVGFCSEPCPPCRICDTNDNYEIFFGNEEDEDARFVMLNDCKHIIENQGMEYWLAKDGGNVGFKTCPKCKSLIKTTQRYSDYVKRAHSDIIKAQKKTVGLFKDNEKERNDLFDKVKQLKATTNHYYLYQTSLGKFIDGLQSRLKQNHRDKRQVFDKFILNDIKRKYEVIRQIYDIANLTDKSVSPNELFEQQLDFITTGLRRDTDCISDQEIADIQQEIGRLLRIVEYNKLRQLPSFHSVKQYNSKFNDLIQQFESKLVKPQQYTEEFDKEIKELLKEINKLLNGGLAISDIERRQILAAMQLTRGHWYKCPNGHVYAITECGGAMQISKCNECGASIGGQNHQLLNDNQVATEMDGARFPAWSEQANMQNYVFNE